MSTMPVARNGTTGRTRDWLLAAVVVVALLCAGATGAVADPTAGVPAPLEHRADVDAVRYEPPVAGHVLRPFDRPTSAFGAGHRGVDLAAGAGTQVRAAAGGIVSFAGPVAGVVWVSIHHRDGIVTSYGPLAGIEVGYGDTLERGAVLGVLAVGGHGHDGADSGLHWGARRDGAYLDPMTLLDGYLSRPSLLGIGTWEGTDHRVVPYEPWGGGRLGGSLVGSSPVADRQGFATSPNPNHLILIAGLGSDSDREVIDADHLGYDPRSVTNLSYAGRHDDGGDPSDSRRDQWPYGASDTWDGIDRAARHLDEQLRAQAAREPGRAVDLVGHSMGGVIVIHYLVNYHDPYDRSLPPIGHVVTIASPLHGSDIAAIGMRLRDMPVVGSLIERLQRAGDGRMPPDAPAIDQLALGSTRLWELAVAWEDALARGTAGPLGTGTRALNIGGSRDVVVPAVRSRQPATASDRGSPTAMLDGEQVVEHRVLPGGHSSVLDTEAVREVVWRFLAGQEVVDSPGHLSMGLGRDLADAARFGTEVLVGMGRLLPAAQ